MGERARTATVRVIMADTRDRRLKVHKLEQKFVKLKQDATRAGVTSSDVARVFTASHDVPDAINNNNEYGKVRGSEEEEGQECRRKGGRIWLMITVPVLCTALYYCEPGVCRTLGRVETAVDDMLFYSRCLVGNNALLQEVARPIVDCSMCENLTSVSMETNISKQTFLRDYAYSSRPVVVRDATVGWAAMHTFNYTFFRQLYLTTPGALRSVEEECQFLPFNVDTSSLADVFRRFDEENYPKEGNYFGW